VDCHLDVHRGELGTLCERCHSPQSWVIPDMMQKHAQTRFALVGAHAMVNCDRCHTNMQKYEYVGLRSDCYACHAGTYEGTTSPNHRSVGFSTDCVQCHSVTALEWSGTFDHARTGFPLTGAHRAIPCTRCHPSGTFTNAPTQCIGCHLTDFTTTANPPHSGFSTECQTCHSTIAWQPATFNHDATFPLTGAHRSVPCADCHAGGRYAGTPRECSGCHLDAYNATTNPVHSPGFPTACQTCHTTTAWRPSTFNHETMFPIAAGTSHPPGRWNACSDCHNNPASYSTFSCTDCHAHNSKTQVDGNHRGVSGYSYSPTSCYTCHPRGR
jgi:Class III cytochrome C family